MSNYKSLFINFPIFFFLLLFSFDAEAFLPDDIQISTIEHLQVVNEEGKYFITLTLNVYNLTSYTFKFRNFHFALGITSSSSGEIILGRAQDTHEITLKPKSDNHVRMVAEITRPIDELHFDMISSDDLSNLLTEPTPVLPIHLTGKFDLSTKFNQAWLHQPGYRINWVIPLSINKDIFLEAYKSIEKAAEEKRPDRSHSNKNQDFLDDDSFE